MIQQSLPLACQSCSGPLQSSRDIQPNRLRQLILFLTSFAGAVFVWWYLRTCCITNDDPRTSEPMNSFLMLWEQRNAALIVGVVFVLVFSLTKRMPDTVTVRCTKCRTFNVYRICFADREAATPPARWHGAGSGDLLPSLLGW
jgi:hypothetical protein